jgi:uncharacterized RDD family membrane protein YckC
MQGQRFHTNSFKRRLLARIIDFLLLQVVIFFPLEFAFKTVSPEMATFLEERANPLSEIRSPSSKEEMVKPVVGWMILTYTSLVALVHFFYRLVFHKYSHATIGKMIMKCRVVSLDPDRKQLTWPQLLKRESLDSFGSAILGLGIYASSFLSKRRRHLADVFAHTMVIIIDPQAEEAAVAPLFFFLGLLVGVFSLAFNMVLLYGQMKLLF